MSTVLRRRWDYGIIFKAGGKKRTPGWGVGNLSFLLLPVAKVVNKDFVRLSVWAAFFIRKPAVPLLYILWSITKENYKNRIKK